MTFEGPSKSYQEDTILELASLTKLLTAIAALQQVEKGVVSLEEDVSHLIPAFSNQKVLHSDPTDEKKILVKDRTQPITFEGLLTHSAGAGYPFTDTRLEKYTNTTGYPTGSVDAAFDFPLSYEPGTSWLYGHSMDRVGQVLEKITGKDLEELFQEGILKPLGITNASFYSLPHPRMAVRKEPGARAVPDPAAHSFTRGNIEAFGGQGLLMPMNDYIKVLQSLLRNDGALLEPETVDLLFQPRLGARPRAGLLKQLENPEWAVGDLPRTGEYDWSIGGLVITGDSHRYRQRDTVLWSGAPSCFWVSIICSTLSIWDRN